MLRCWSSRRQVAKQVHNSLRSETTAPLLGLWRVKEILVTAEVYALLPEGS